MLQYFLRRSITVSKYLQPLNFRRSVSSGSTRHFLSIHDVSTPELCALIHQARHAKDVIRSGDYRKLYGPLCGQTVAMMFSKRSTRTRVSTEVAVTYMGGNSMFLGKDDIQLGVNESLYDTARVISSMVSCVVARVGPHSDIVEISKSSTVPVINALCDAYHPLQAVADMVTIADNFTATEGLKLAWIGDANNVLFDLITACAKLGISVSIATPAAYPVPTEVLQKARMLATNSGATIEALHEPEIAVKDAHIIVTDTWVSMGQESEKQYRLAQFKGFQVTTDLAKRGGALKDWKFMHCLPRKSDEVTDEVFYSNRSLVFAEAENRVYAAIAALEAFVVKKGRFEE